MPYKNKTVQKAFLKEWREEHQEEARWALKIWRDENPERNKELNNKSYELNKHFYLAVNKLQRKLDKEEII